MPDRVREAVFGMLGSHYDCPGALPPLRVADVFAGSGSMGLEALSRGARSCCFFEHDREALLALRKNLGALGVGPEGRIVEGNAWTQAALVPDDGAFELVFLDPPYRDSDDTSADGPVMRFLARIADREDNRPVVVLHHRAAARFASPVHGGWRASDRRTFGTNGVTFFTR